MRMTTRFWLLQALGWLPYLLLQLLVRTDDLPVDTAGHALSALVLWALAVAGSVVLRQIYRRLHTRPWGELRWLGLALAASVSVAMLVDAIYYAGLWLLSDATPELALLYAAQPLFARAPLLVVMYVLWSLLYLALSRQQRLQQAAAAETALLLAVKEAQIQRLLGQLSPHFTFNAINNIRALILKDADAAREMLARFASTLRYQFANPGSALVSVADEMAVVRDYLALVRLQLGARLQYQERIDPAALPVQVPKFALQLLVENAIKHGLGLAPGPGQLDIAIGVDGCVLQMDVSNSGTMGDRAASQGIGLDNLEQRLRLGFGDAAGFTLQQTGDRVLARIRIPATARTEARSTGAGTGDSPASESHAPEPQAPEPHAPEPHAPEPQA